MKDKLKQIFDSRATWLALGTVAGVFSEKAAAVVNVIGQVVMNIL